MGDISLIEKIEETQQMIAVTQQRAMAANPFGQTWTNTGGPENLEAFSPGLGPAKAYVEGANAFEGEMETPTGAAFVEADEQAPTYVGGSDNQYSGTKKSEEVAPSETPTEERTPRALRRPQFGSMSLAEAENYSSWRGSRTI